MTLLLNSLRCFLVDSKSNAGKTKLADSVPYLPTEMSETVLFSVALIITGFLLVLAIDKIASIKSKVVS